MAVSVKQQLIAQLEYEREGLDCKLRELKGRGSGPLPAWAQHEAKLRGLTEAPFRSRGPLLGPRS